ncbi:MAG: hypothetical protein AAFQ27_05520 [Pseudomonadota bacterium]
MNTFTKRLALLPAAALAFTLPMSAPAMAGEKSEGIVVRSQAALEQWQADTTSDINRSLKFARIPPSTRPNDAVVQITFTLGADGKPDNIELLNGDGNWAARKAAMYAVRRLNNLDEVPVGNAQNAQFLANIFFASSKDVHKQLAAKLAQTERTRIAAAGGENEYILLGG